MRALTQSADPLSRLRRGAIALILAALSLTGSFPGALSPAAAQDVRVERTRVVQTLAGKFDELPASIGLASDGSVIEVFKRPDGATWTIIVTLPNGYSRVLASGEAWMAVSPRISRPTS